VTPFGVTNISRRRDITVGAKNSPLAIGSHDQRADKGAQFLTFEDDFSASGYGIRLKDVGLDDVLGHWGFDAKGQDNRAVCRADRHHDELTGTLLGPVKSFKSISGAAANRLGTFHWKGDAGDDVPGP